MKNNEKSGRYRPLFRCLILFGTENEKFAEYVIEDDDNHVANDFGDKFRNLQKADKHHHQD